MKIKGAELQQFTEEAWPGEDWYWDHGLFDEPDLDETYETDDVGPILYQGLGDDPSGGKGYDLGALIRKWRKARDFDQFTIQVKKPDVERVRAALLGVGIKI
jgi:hypothetical protein